MYRKKIDHSGKIVFHYSYNHNHHLSQVALLYQSFYNHSYQGQPATFFKFFLWSYPIL